MGDEAELFRVTDNEFIRAGEAKGIRDELLRLNKTRPNAYFMKWRGERYAPFQAERLEFDGE
jgi:hypothetical protein